MHDLEDCRQWLHEVWAVPAFAEAVQAASPQFAARVENIIRSGGGSARQIRKATSAVTRYLLRATGRPTPFGLFAGVAVAGSGPAFARVGTEHRSVVRPDTLWLDHVRRDLQGRRDVLPHLALQVSDLVERQGDSLVRTLPGGRQAAVRVTRPLAALIDAAATPVPCTDLTQRLVTMGGTEERAKQLIADALEAGLLTSALAAPMTDRDPLGHLLRSLTPLVSYLEPETHNLLQELDAIHQLLADHDTAPPATARQLRRTAEDRMSHISPQGRVRLSVDLCLDATVQLPEHVLDEAELAANALLRLTRHQGEKPQWAAYHTLFWERYGAGCLVPVREAAHLAAGVGLPADFPMSLWPPQPIKALPRDELLLAKAWQAIMSGADEVRLTDADLDALCGRSIPEDVAIAPHMEMAVRVHAATDKALGAGAFTLGVRPAWSTGTLTGRFAATLGNGSLRSLCEKLPTGVDGALPAQLSFTPNHPHSENVARMPAYLPHTISVGEHRAPAAGAIPIDDLAVLSTNRRLHLISLSRRRVVEPVVLHPLALEKQAPPLARFIALLGRGFATAWTHFDWGPSAAGLPYLPRVRYRKAILSPARWRLTADDLPRSVFRPAWHEALLAWARTWKCPPPLELRDDDRTLRLELREPLHARILHRHLQRYGYADLAEGPEDGEQGWIGHAHEVTLSLVSTRPPLPHPDVTTAPVVTNEMLLNPGDDLQPWVQAKLFTHPTTMDQILTRRLPGLLHRLGDTACWFIRYRTVQEEDHLRLRIAAHGAAAHAETMRSLARWAAGLQAEGLAARLVLDGYRPEFGRYGTGDALAAAEAVFVADSEAVCGTLAVKDQDRRVLCALGMLDIARGLLGEEEGTQWMATTAPRGGTPDSAVSRQTLRHLQGSAARPAPDLGEAWQQRRGALHAYRAYLDAERTSVVLESLLHMHHIRLIGPDREVEAVCRHAARQACRSLLAQRGKS
ncbi:lantibiotic dehydratase [Streptomyces sp. NPDC050732]|uniref:lantibiotic dehydratase n=1 Tax=Streptomyces sp. NPDC050732 TaxID=3154632 RepID=UPI00342CE3FC